jgi:pyrimidine deaminase RibD-like protein
MVKTAFIKTCVWLVARLSPEKYKVGAIYIEGRKYSAGYNRSAAYGDHAEDMAVEWFIRKYGVEPNGGTMWCTFSPCTNCEETVAKYNMKSKYIKKYAGKL